MGGGKGVTGVPSRVVILVDTNAVLLVGAGYDLFEDLGERLGARFTCLVIPRILDELLDIWHQLRPSDRRKARLGLSLVLSRCAIDPYVCRDEGKDVDEALVKCAIKLKKEGLMVLVATSDRELRRRLRKLGVPSVYLREESGMFEVEWDPLL